jgi:hypothetical protein
MMANGEVPRGPALDAGALRRDSTALADAYDAYGPAVWLAARRHGTEHDAHETTRAVFVELGRAPDRYDRNESLGTRLVARAETHARATDAAPDLGGPRRAPATLTNDACLAITMAQRGSTCAEIAVALRTNAATVQLWMREGLGLVSSVMRSTPAASGSTRPSAR